MTGDSKLAVSTSEVGNAFRDNVKQLLEMMPGCHSVEAEKSIAYQAVDLYYEIEDHLGRRRVACECKAYAKPLTRSDIESKIYGKYRPLLDGGLVDAVQIVAPHDLGEQAKQYVDNLRGFSFRTAERLEAELIDLRRYAMGILDRYRREGLDKYYIRPRLSDGTDLQGAIENWLEGESPQPIAILAGYGMGKSSFALHLAAQLAERWLKRESRRVPILVPLWEISAEQGLEGLLGKIFSARQPVAHYSFDLFMELNRRGRLALVLDGFDEMKHTLSWTEFKYNFRQINRLVTGNARTMVLGRPTAFLSETEHEYVLRGKRPDGTAISDGPVYREIRLDGFRGEDISDFMRRYAEYRLTESRRVRGGASESSDFDVRIESIRNDPERSELARRPVQARMLTELAMDPAAEWRRFTRFDLYQQFIRRIVEREMDKPTRQFFSAAERLTFQREVAWWLWRKRATPSFRGDEMPRHLIMKYGRDDVDGASVLRDLLAGSILERKSADAYYFPHRSFLEFLVAEQIVESFWSVRDLEGVAHALTDEVEAFVKESGRFDAVASWADSVEQIPGAVTARFLSLVGWACSQSKAAQQQDWIGRGPRGVFVQYAYLTALAKPPNEVINELAHVHRGIDGGPARLIALLCILAAAKLASPALQRSALALIVAALLRSTLSDLRDILSRPQRVTASVDLSNPFMAVLVASMKRSPVPSGDVVIEFDSKACFDSIQSALPITERLPDLEETVLFAEEEFSLRQLAEVDGQFELRRDGAAVAQFFAKFPEPGLLVPVHRR